MGCTRKKSIDVFPFRTTGVPSRKQPLREKRTPTSTAFTYTYVRYASTSLPGCHRTPNKATVVRALNTGRDKAITNVMRRCPHGHAHYCCCCGAFGLFNLACRIPPHPSRAPITGTTTSPAVAVRRTFFGTEKSLFKKPGGSADIPMPPPLPSPTPPGASSGIITSPSARSSGLCKQSTMQNEQSLLAILNVHSDVACLLYQTGFQTPNKCVGAIDSLMAEF